MYELSGAVINFAKNSFTMTPNKSRLLYKLSNCKNVRGIYAIHSVFL